MADDAVKYETKTVRTIRGTESMTTARWIKDGWEIVSQTPGKVQTEIAMRRPKRKSRVLLYAVSVGVFAFVLATIIAAGVINERNNAIAEPVATPEQTKTSEEPEQSKTPEPAETQDTASTPAVMTAASSREFGSILALTDHCDPDIENFADAHRGETVSFDAYVGAMNEHAGASTRYDILIGAGDFSETAAPGPAFQFRDVSVTNDLHLAGDVPDTIGVGQNLSVTAEIDEYEGGTCLFLLEPVYTSAR